MAVKFTPPTYESRDVGKAKLKKNLQALSRYFVKIGVPSTAAAPTDDKGAPMGISMAQLAYIHEQGSPSNNMPARPFNRLTKNRCKGQFRKLLRRSYLKILRGASPTRELKIIGVAYEGEMKNTFTISVFVPLKPATVRSKGSSRPLIDSGALRGSIISKVVTK